MREIDLHVHTNISDGSETPAETVKYARSLGLRAIAVTDHDSINGVAEAQKAGKECGVEVVAGMELGCGWYEFCRTASGKPISGFTGRQCLLSSVGQVPLK